MQQPLRNLSALELIQLFFPKKLRLTVGEVALIINRCEQGVRNDISYEKFPIKSYKENGRRYFDIRTVAEHIDVKHANEASAANNTHLIKPTRIGRPSKTEVIDAKKLGISVKQMRAQKIGGAI